MYYYPNEAWAIYSIIASVVLMSGIMGFAVINPDAFAAANKVTVCHKPGTPAEQTLSISENALQAHLDHGDFRGTCERPPAPNGDSVVCYCDGVLEPIVACIETIECDPTAIRSFCEANCNDVYQRHSIRQECRANVCDPRG